MKRNLAEDLRSAGNMKPKLFFKFGEGVYRGFNVIRNNDIGRLVAEIASATGTSDIHILALGIGGGHGVCRDGPLETRALFSQR